MYGDFKPSYTGHVSGIPRLSIPDLNMMMVLRVSDMKIEKNNHLDASYHQDGSQLEY